jgi:hypothetical protein
MLASRAPCLGKKEPEHRRGGESLQNPEGLGSMAECPRYTFAEPANEISPMRAPLRCIVLGFTLACYAKPPHVGSSPSEEGPRAAWLAPLSLGTDVRHWHVTIRGVRDRAERPLSEKTVSQSSIAAPASDILIASAWPPPLTSVDSLVIAKQALRPVREVLAYNGFTRRYQYAGAHVWGTVQHADSAPRNFDRVFPERLFAFAEVDLLVRAVPFQSGWTTIVPLFSEADEDVEHDTITVVGTTRVRLDERDEAAWIVRFADPAIISTYTVLAGSRAILSIDTEQRRSHAVIRYRDASQDWSSHSSRRAL